MDYNRFLSEINAQNLDDESYDVREIPRKPSSQGAWERVRFGEPSMKPKFEKWKNEASRIAHHCMEHGYSAVPSVDNLEFRRVIFYFRSCLDLWEEFSTTKVFTKEEIYVRSLLEGHSFTEYIKKCRSACLRGKTTEVELDILEEHFHESYDGYNSIIHERYLIHWDDRDSVDDIKYSFIPTKEVDVEELRGRVVTYLEFLNLDEDDFSTEIDMVSQLRNTVMLDPTTSKTALMREFWSKEVDTSAPYYAKRTVVLTDPGSTRDTGIGDPSTILKVKVLNTLARKVTEKSPHSANCSAIDAQKRYNRVLKRNGFLHLDFKKFGISSPRTVMNVVIEEMCRIAGIDPTNLLINDFFVEIDGEVYKTARGTCLGWLDSVIAVGVLSILYDLSSTKGMEFDFINFNDDVEISFWADRSIQEKGSLLRIAVIHEFVKWDFLVSTDKTYPSKASVFLERYNYYSRHYSLDMYKEQLTVKAYAQSLVTRYPWRAKFLFSVAYQWTKSDYARDRCIDTCPKEYCSDEIHEPVYSGGWYLEISKKLDRSLQISSTKMIRLGVALSRWENKTYTVKPKRIASYRKIVDCINRKTASAGSSELASLVLRDPPDLVKLNEESTWTGSAMIWAENYSGNAQEWASRMRDYFRIESDLELPFDRDKS